MTQQSAHLDSILKQHEELLVHSEKVNDLDILQVQKFLEILAQAGAETEDPDKRSLLRSLIRYWASFIDNKTGRFPLVQLQPFSEIDSSDKSLIIYEASGYLPTAGTKKRKVGAITQPLITSNPSSKGHVPLQQNKLRQQVKRIFEIDIYFLGARKSKLFRSGGMIFNILGSILLGIWQHSWWIGLAALIVSLLIFLLHIIIVNRTIMLSFGILLALFWGIVGWASETIVQSKLPVGWLPPPVIVSSIFFIISSYLHIHYVRNKDLL